MDKPPLEARDLGRKVGSSWLWRHLSFELQPGEKLALVGPSGSGKSLLLRAIAGLDHLDEGEVLLEGRALTQWNPPAYRRRTMYLAQAPALFEGKVADNLRLAFSFKIHHGKRYDANKALEYLQLLGRQPSFLQQEAANLSGGERQITALLRVLLLEPQILLLDEPTASLDAGTTQAAEDLISHWLHGNPRRACLWTSHSAAQLARVATRRLALDPHEQPRD